MTEKNLVLIGPMGAGKSTLARQLARRLDLPVVSLDRVRWRYFVEMGYDRHKARQVEQSEGLRGLHRYRQPFEAKVVEHALRDHDECIFDFGAGHIVYDDAALQAHVQSVLASSARVLLVLPSENEDASVHVLTARAKERGRGAELVEEFVRHPANRLLAEHVAYTEGRTPEETCDESIRALGLLPRQRALTDVVIDRTSYAQHRRACAERLASESNYMSVLEELQNKRRATLERRMAGVLDRPLTPAAWELTRETLEDVEWTVRTLLRESKMTDEARSRLESIHAERLARDATLRQLLALDPFDSVFPFQDGPVLERLAGSDTIGSDLAALAHETLLHRAFHRPQRTRYLFLHELVVGYFLNVFKSSGVTPKREELDVAGHAYEPLAAYAVGLMASGSGLPLRDVLALHAADNDAVEGALPRWMLDALLASAHVYFYMEMLMIYMRKGATRRILTDLLLFFTIPALEHGLDDTRKSLRPDAGERIDDRFCLSVYGYAGKPLARPANEVDVVRVLSALVDEVFA